MSSDGDLIRAERLRAGLSQRALAARSGVAQPAVAAIEKGRTVPTQPTRDRLLAAVAERPSVRLARHHALVCEILDRFGVENLHVFGSVARGEDRLGSDVDILARLPADMGLFRLNGLRLELEDVLGVPVDIVSDAAPADALRLALRDAVPL